jgi:hypothetical protein
MAPPHGSSPVVSYGSSLHSLVLARIALQAHQRQQARALEGLARDTAFWRMLLSDGSLLSKSVGTGRMLSNVQQLSDILSHTTLSASEQVFVEQILQPLSAVEQDWSRAIRREYCIFGNGSIVAYNNGSRGRQSPYANGPAHRVMRLAFRPNHTKNLVQERAEQVLAGDAHRSRHFGDSWWDYTYNPIGKYLVYEYMADASTFVPYRDRLKDLDGLLRLVRLQWEIRKQNVGAANVPAFLDANAAIANNRDTGHTVRWDAKRNVLWLARLAARQGEQNIFEAPRE